MTPVLHQLEIVGSTQDCLQEFALRGDPAGTAVLAAEQTSGRGRRGRTWVSPRGGLWLSVLCRPTSEPAIEVLSLRVALAVAEVVESHAHNVVLELKWPNDLILDDRKLGGILCEAHWQGESPAWVGVGLGLNLGNPIPAELTSQAVALSHYAPQVTPTSIAPDLVKAIVGASQIDRMLSPAEVAQFSNRDWLLGREIAEPTIGVADGISREGLLRVRGAEGKHQMVRAGEVIVRREK